MRHFFVLFLSIAAQSLCLAGFDDFTSKTRIDLVFPFESARPGQTFLAGVRFALKDGWHTYWRYPGDSGAPPSIKWKLPPGVTTGELLWPVPRKLTEEGLVTYIYEKDLVLFVPMTISAETAKGVVEIQAQIDWIECKTSCVSLHTEISAHLTIAENNATAAANAALLASYQKRLPLKEPPFAVQSEITDFEGKTSLQIALPNSFGSADFFPFDNDLCEISHITESVTNSGNSLVLRKTLVCKGQDRPKTIDGLLILSTTNETIGYNARLNAQAAASGGNKHSLLVMVLYAFLGGLILNVMPCVLPVIALKILGFVSQSTTSPSRTRMLGLAYGIGVILSFASLAGMVILVKQAGHSVGWGMQFGNPQFLVALTILVMLVALNLFGLFEVTLSGRVMGAAGGLASKEGITGALFNGVLAVALATPCTAPYLGAALGFAFLQPAPVILLIFISTGLGLASPYVLLSWNPGWLKYLPKPGIWMEKLKIAFGFPMMATAIWMFLLTANHYGKQIIWFGLFLIVLAMALWVFGEFYQRGLGRRGLALATALLLAAGGYVYGMELQLDWRHAGKGAPLEAGASAESLPWQPWSSEKVDQGRMQGRPVFVDFTADWCLTCQVNKKTSIDIPSVREKLKSINALVLLGDYTRLPDDITRELNRFERAGVPLVLVYPKDQTKPPLVLPEFLTPQTVLNALDEAGR